MSDALRYFSEQELLDLDMGTVKGKVNRTLLAGTYLFAMMDAGLVRGEDRKTGKPRLEVAFRAESVVAELDDQTQNPEDYVGQSVFERFYAPTPDNVGYTKQFLDNVFGTNYDKKFSEAVHVLNENGAVLFKARVENRTYQDRLQANLTREPNHFTGFEKLSDAEIEQAKRILAG